MSTHPSDRFTLLGAGTSYQKELCAMLDETGFFKDMDWADVETFAKYIRAYAAKSGAVIFKEGQPGTFLALVVSGKVNIFKEDHNFQDKWVATAGPGKLLGEMAIIDGENRSATCVIDEPTVFILLTKENFLRIAKDHPALSLKIVLKIARLLSQRLRMTSGLLVDYLDQ